MANMKTYQNQLEFDIIMLSDNSKRKAIDDVFARPSKILHSELKNGDVKV